STPAGKCCRRFVLVRSSWMFPLMKRYSTSNKELSTLSAPARGSLPRIIHYMKKRKWTVVLVFSFLGLFFASLITYPKWIIINREKKISQLPSKWKELPLGIKRGKIIQLLAGTFDEDVLWWPDKQDLWIKKDEHGWYRLNIFYNSDTAVRYY